MYWEYGQSLLGRYQLDTVNMRLFPGTGFLYALFGLFITNRFLAGLVVSLVVLFGILYILRKFDSSVSIFFLVGFPPVVLRSFGVISSESIYIFLLLLSFFLWKKRRKNWSYGILGILLWIRLITIVVVFVRVILDIKEKNILQAIKGIGIIAASAGVFVAYNLIRFHQPFMQFVEYPHAGHAEIAIFQLLQDIPRSLSWHQYTIFLSGISYLILLAVYFFFAARKYKQTALSTYYFWSAIAMTCFVFTIGPTPFLEEFPRFLIPVFICLGLIIKPPQRVIFVLLPLISFMSILI